MPLIHSKSDSAFVSDDTLAYVAGFFDGEGCVNFTVSGQVRTPVLRVMVRNTNFDIIKKFQETFGGRIETAAHHHRPNWKRSYCWRIDGGRAVDFLRRIDRFVFLKRDQILTATMWDDFRNRSTRYIRKDEGYKACVDLLVKQMQWLNRKGPRQADDIEPMEEALAGLSVDPITEDIDHALN